MEFCYTTVKTDKASKYLQQLCKHFRHKVTVDFDPQNGRVDFPGGVVHMLAGEEGLSFFCRADMDDGIPRMKSVLDSHLLKFAWREELDIRWIEGLPDQLPLDRAPALSELIDNA
ncbi:MAG: DUF2218 domain-containing protein [Alphaproteobacteria bacterium]